MSASRCSCIMLCRDALVELPIHAPSTGFPRSCERYSSRSREQASHSTPETVAIRTSPYLRCRAVVPRRACSHRCSEHQTTTRHDEDKYKRVAGKVAEWVRTTYPDLEVSIAASRTNRIGALEVVAGTLHRGRLRTKVVYSKLARSRWPTRAMIVDSLSKFAPEHIVNINVVLEGAVPDGYLTAADVMLPFTIARKSRYVTHGVLDAHLKARVSIPSGVYDIIIEGNDKLHAVDTEIEVISELPSVDVTLRVCRRMRVRVTNEEGQPVKGATVASEDRLGVCRTSATTDAAGDAVLDYEKVSKASDANLVVRCRPEYSDVARSLHGSEFWGFRLVPMTLPWKRLRAVACDAITRAPICGARVLVVDPRRQVVLPQRAPVGHHDSPSISGGAGAADPAVVGGGAEESSQEKAVKVLQRLTSDDEGAVECGGPEWEWSLPFELRFNLQGYADAVIPAASVPAAPGCDAVSVVGLVKTPSDATKVLISLQRGPEPSRVHLEVISARGVASVRPLGAPVPKPRRGESLSVVDASAPLVVSLDAPGGADAWYRVVVVRDSDDGRLSQSGARVTLTTAEGAIGCFDVPLESLPSPGDTRETVRAGDRGRLFDDLPNPAVWDVCAIHGRTGQVIQTNVLAAEPPASTDAFVGAIRRLTEFVEVQRAAGVTPVELFHIEEGSRLARLHPGTADDVAEIYMHRWQLKSTLAEHDVRMSDAELDFVFRMVDTNGDGRCSTNEMDARFRPATLEMGTLKQTHRAVKQKRVAV